jgi:hypothetical protein
LKLQLCGTETSSTGLKFLNRWKNKNKKHSTQVLDSTCEEEEEEEKLFGVKYICYTYLYRKDQAFFAESCQPQKKSPMQASRVFEPEKQSFILTESQSWLQPQFQKPQQQVLVIVRNFDNSLFFKCYLLREQ